MTMTTTLPRLTSLKMELDTSPESFGWLRDSSDIADDAEALRARMAEEGYLYLPGYLNRDEVLDARQELLTRLEAAGLIEPGTPLEEGIAVEPYNANFQPLLAIDNPPLMKVLHEGPMIEFYERFLGQPVRYFDYTWMRAVRNDATTPPHMDVVYMGRGTPNLWTAWTPYGDVPLELGGLMVLEKSHLHERLNNNYGKKDVDKFCSNRRDSDWVAMGGGGNIRANGTLSPNPVKLRQNLGGRWLTAPEYRAGDLLTFSILTVHGSLDNTTNRIRLSSDTRYQPASEPADERWIGPNPIAHGPEAKRGMIC